MSDHSNYHPPAATDPALDLTGAQRSDAASGGSADGTADNRNTSPSTWDPELLSGYGAYQDDDLSDPFPEIGQSVASDALTTTQQESSTVEAINHETMRQPLSIDNESAGPFPAIEESKTSDYSESVQQEQQSGFAASAYKLFHVSFASERDLESLSDIHARASASKLDRATMYSPERYDNRLEIGRFHYGQAFAAKDEDIILKAINKDSEISVGCAWLQLHTLHKRNQKIQFCQPSDRLPLDLKKRPYKWVHRNIHQHRQEALRKSTRPYGTPHYCEFRSFAMFRYEFQASATEKSGQYDN